MIGYIKENIWKGEKIKIMFNKGVERFYFDCHKETMWRYVFEEIKAIRKNDDGRNQLRKENG
jgi:hypothetical protein